MCNKVFSQPPPLYDADCRFLDISFQHSLLVERSYSSSLMYGKHTTASTNETQTTPVPSPKPGSHCLCKTA